MLKQFRPPPLWILYLLIATLLVAGSFFTPRDQVFAPGLNLADPGKATFDALKDLMALVLTLTTAMLGATGALIVKGRDWVRGWTAVESFLLLIVFLCGVVSFYGVYTCQVAILSMANAASLNPLEKGLMFSLRLQYFGLIAGAFFLGLAFTLMVGRARGIVEPEQADTTKA